MANKPASEWRKALQQPDASVRRVLAEVYGPDTNQHASGASLICSALETFLAGFGDGPVCVVRAPGRINLRGMHVDTHGGWLNLMTHHREVVIAVSPCREPRIELINASRAHAPVTIALDTCRGPQHAAWEQWMEAGPTRPGGWGNYALGCALRAAYQWPEASLRGMRAAVAGNLPEGSSLSSSAALCIGLLLALATAQERSWDAASLVLAARDAEWYAGARTGTSDQTAIVLGRRGALLHAAPFAADFSLDTVSYLPWPEELCVLVVDSHTTRALGGAAIAGYATNRFAYSIALHVFREALLARGHAQEKVAMLDRLSRFLPEAIGGDAAVHAILRSLPEEVSLDAIRSGSDPRECEAQYARLFGHLPEADRPMRFHLRGPLCYALAESERARHFPELIASGCWEEAGRLMTIGHAGDRVSGRYPVARDADPLHMHPGAYGASTPALDAIVDEALSLGALGACLTGAGMGGAVLALCRRSVSAPIAAGLRAFLATPHYAALARLSETLSAAAAADAVCENHSVAGAGRLDLPL